MDKILSDEERRKAIDASDDLSLDSIVRSVEAAVLAKLREQVPFGWWHQGAEEESDFHLHASGAGRGCPDCIPLYATPLPAVTQQELMQTKASLEKWIAIATGDQALAPAVAQVPLGYKLVPVEPTPQMIEAAHNAFMKFGGLGANAISAALAAAPEAPAQAVSEREAFEAEQIRQVSEYSHGRHAPDLQRTGEGYSNPLVHHAWRGWQARAALTQQPAAQPTPVRDVDGDNERIAATLYEAITPDGPPWARLESKVAERWRRAVQGLSDLSAQLPAVAQVLPGYKLVPVEPTDKMTWAAIHAVNAASHGDIDCTLTEMEEGLRAAIIAAPEAPAQEKQ